MIRPALLAVAILAAAPALGQSRNATEVTRYHLDEAVAPGPIAIEPRNPNDAGPGWQAEADAVATELAKIGLIADPAASSPYIAAIAFQRTTRGYVRKRPKFSFGIGGGSYGGGGIGLGGGISTGIGGGTAAVVASELSVRIRRRADGVVVWEGTAQRTDAETRRPAAPADVARRMAAALFKGFPGQSGITIGVP